MCQYGVRPGKTDATYNKNKNIPYADYFQALFSDFQLKKWDLSFVKAKMIFIIIISVRRSIILAITLLVFDLVTVNLVH